MDSDVVGLRDLDGQFAKMLKVKIACDDAGIPYPKEVRAYFNDKAEYDEAPLRREMAKIDITAAVNKTSYDSTNAWTVTLAKLPKECVAVVFENSY